MKNGKLLIICAVLSLAIALLLMLGDVSLSQNVAEKSKIGFRQLLESVLDRGVVSKDKHAQSACIALLFSNDPVLIEVAAEVSRAREKLIGGEILRIAMSKLEKNKCERDCATAAKRLTELLSIARFRNDGNTYVSLSILHLDSCNDQARWGAMTRIQEARPYIDAVFKADKTQPPEFPKVFKPGMNQKLKMKWTKWIAKADKVLVKDAMSKKFADDKAILKKLLDVPSEKPVVPVPPGKSGKDKK